MQTGEDADIEKDLCLERYVAFAKRVTDRLMADGHWADYIDPCSGLSICLLYTSPSPRDVEESRMPSSA